MKEYILYYEDIFYRFSIEKSGLCMRKMSNGRFGETHVLLPGAKEDFCALSDSVIHIICQSDAGSIIYLTFDGSTWQKTVLLESKEGRAYKKFFSLIKLGNLINLFYTINHDEKTMLIHQILDGTYSAPEVVDFITPCGARFVISGHISSDVSISYKNQNGICGSKIYRWSHKSFMPFVPFTENTDFEPHFVNITESETQMTGITDNGREKQVIFYYKNNFGESIKHELAASCDNFSPVIFTYKDKTVVEWVDGGCVMAAVSSDGGRTFSPPVKYIKNAFSDILLFEICAPLQKYMCYACSAGNNITFYSAQDILNDIKNKKKGLKAVQQGSDALDFAARSGYKKTGGWDDDPYITQKELKNEIDKLRLLIDDLNKQLEEINKKISEENTCG